MKRTIIIVIEGIDGSGKTVQFNMLKEKLIAMGKSVATRSFPRYGSYFGEQIGRYLSGNGAVPATEVDNKSMALWFALDRWESFSDYRDGETDYLLINRYVMSNAVYQSIRDGDSDISDWVIDLEFNHFKLPRPDVTLFFSVATKWASDNVLKKERRDYVEEAKDVYEASPGIQSRARELYLKCARRYGGISVIECMGESGMLGVEEISQKVTEELERLGLL
ncbi:MAG: hypothetical protein Q4B99_01260 [Clostridia bacterium]|nr:hypothetical protein [Clostridia bacterium]